MAERSSGGWVRSAITSVANTRPCALLSGASSAESGVAPSSTRASASATEISAMSASCLGLSGRRAIVAGFTAKLLDETNILDAHAALDGLDHIVDGQARDRDSH